MWKMCRHSMCEGSKKPKHFCLTVVCKRLVPEISWRIRNFVPKTNFLQFQNLLYIFWLMIIIRGKVINRSIYGDPVHARYVSLSLGLNGAESSRVKNNNNCDLSIKCSTHENSFAHWRILGTSTHRSTLFSADIDWAHQKYKYKSINDMELNCRES